MISDLFGSEEVEEFLIRRARSACEARRFAIDDSRMGFLFVQRGPVQQFKIDPIVSEECSLMLGSKPKLRCVG